MAYKRISPQPVAEGGTGAQTLTGVLIGNGTSAVTANTVTQHDVLVGGTSNAITSVAPSATSGVPLVSAGAAADPAFGTAVVAGGGTGLTSTTAYAVLCGGTTSTAALQSIAGVGSSGQYLTSNGAGALPTFQSSTRINTVAVQVFTSNGTYTPTSGMVYCMIEAVGGGGGGGGAAATAGGTTSIGGGGGAGEYARGIFSAATIGASKSVTIGAAGAANSGAAGGNGGNTSVGSTVISANGGTGGSASAAGAAANVSGAAGGSGGTGGDFRMTGGHGNAGYIATTASSFSTSGGSTVYGFGGGSEQPSNTGLTATGYGGGGGGAANYTSQSARSGGAGTAGIVIVTEFIAS